MRVIAGSAKGHRLKTPTVGTRPMTDRMKEALFSTLGDVEGIKVLDLYAGSGALGLEALSRGGSHSTFVESARDAIVKLEQNVETTGFADTSEIIWAEVRSTLSRPATHRVDLIFLDPPYSAAFSDVRRDLEAIVMGGFLADDGRIVVHRPMKEKRLDVFGLDLMWERDYGQAHVYIFCHEDEEG
ncbi:MAG: 16S rRNA (guanine(966)-N(2))-methyltransferase RsmD [Actinobacteria bacterium]|nr:16S rRNA (guanine(966)-N(2))-methyltransferase RsmD [Actinomycetota bacterium]